MVGRTFANEEVLGPIDCSKSGVAGSTLCGADQRFLLQPKCCGESLLLLLLIVRVRLVLSPALC